MARTKPLDPIVLALARRRVALGLSQMQVGLRMGYVSAHQVASWERGDHCPSVATVRRWAAALGCVPALTVRQEAGRG